MQPVEITMSMNNFVPRVVCLLLMTALPLSSVSAQLTVTGIGVDPLKDQAYSCVRYSNKSQNAIEVKGHKSNESKFYSVKQAQRAIKRSIKMVDRRRKKLRKSLKKVKNGIRKLSRKFILTPKNREKLELLRVRSENIEVRISILTSQIASLKETQRGITSCKKDELVASGFQIASGVVIDSRGRSNYFVGAHVSIDNWDTSKSVVCVKVDGRVRDYRVRPPTSCLRTDPYDTSRCLAVASDYLGSRHFVSAAGRSGPQDPGTCPGDPAMCSLAEATADVLKRISGVKYQIVGTAKSASDCF